MVDREKLLAESRREMYDSLPKIAVGIAIAFLIWLFGVLIFLPLANMLGDPFVFGLIGLGSLISAIILIALVIVIFGIFREVLDITDALAGYAAAAYSRKETSDEKVERYRRAFRGIAYVLLAVIAFLFFLPFIGDHTGSCGYRADHPGPLGDPRPLPDWQTLLRRDRAVGRGTHSEDRVAATGNGPGGAGRIPQ